MPIKPARLEARLRNNVLWHMIFDNFKSVFDFCNTVFPGENRYSYVSGLLNLKLTPIYKKTGVYRKFAQIIADYFKMLPEDLFPEKLYRTRQTEIVVEIPFSQLTSEDRLYLPDVEIVVQQNDLREQVRAAIATLPTREQEVLRLREDGLTLKEIGLYFNVTTERIRQIEARALRRLRHPKMNRRLRELMDGTAEDVPHE